MNNAAPERLPTGLAPASQWQLVRHTEWVLPVVELKSVQSRDYTGFNEVATGPPKENPILKMTLMRLDKDGQMSFSVFDL